MSRPANQLGLRQGLGQFSLSLVFTPLSSTKNISNQKIILVKWSDCYIARRWMKTFKKELTKRRKNCDCVPNLFAMSFISIMNDFLWGTRRNIINNLTFLAENFAHIFNASIISEFKYGPIFNNALEVQKL